MSELTGRPVRGDIAMTGEITLSGKVLPVGGIKEKVLAARRVGIRRVILPRQNEKSVIEDIGEDLRKDLTIHLVSTIDEVIDLALTPAPAPVTDRRARARPLKLARPQLDDQVVMGAVPAGPFSRGRRASAPSPSSGRRSRRARPSPRPRRA